MCPSYSNSLWQGSLPLQSFPSTASKVPKFAPAQLLSEINRHKLCLSHRSYLLIGLIDAATAVWYFTWRKVALLGSPPSTCNEMTHNAMSTLRPVTALRMSVHVVSIIITISRIVGIGGKSG